MSISIVSDSHSQGQNRELATLMRKQGILGIWYWNVQADLLFTDAAFAEMFAVDPLLAARGAPVEAFVAGIDARDRKRVSEAIRLAVIAGTDFFCHYRLAMPKAARSVAAYARCHCGPDGRTHHYLGVALQDDRRKMPATNHLDQIADHALEASRLAAQHGEGYLQYALGMVLLELGGRLSDEMRRSPCA